MDSTMETMDFKEAGGRGESWIEVDCCESTVVERGAGKGGGRDGLVSYV